MTATDLSPGAVYTAAEVAGVLRVSVETVHRRIKAGVLAPLPRLGGGHRFLGAEVLRVLGEQVLTLAQPTETRQQRERRAARAVAEIRRTG